MPTKVGLAGRPRRRCVAIVRARDTHCHLCGYPVDQTLDRIRHPLGSCVDEFIPRSKGGDPTDPTNCFLAHRTCNGSRGTQEITPDVQARCRYLAERLMARPTLRRW